jgi:hypothetical protein
MLFDDANLHEDSLTPQVASVSEAFLGYVAVHAQADGFVGGLLILDGSGDPVDFAYTDPITVGWPSRVLFGTRLAAYIAARALAPPLLGAVTVKPAVLCFDDPSVLARRCSLDTPVAVCCPAGTRAPTRYWRELPLETSAHSPQHSWWGQVATADRVESILASIADSRSPAEMIEPFDRLRLALRQVPVHSGTP